MDPDTRLPVRGLSLPPEGSATLLLSLSVPEDAEEGVYVVAVRVSGDLEYAVNYTVTVVRGHTVKVFVPETAVATTGPYATFSVVLKNVGTRTEVVDVSVEGAPLGYKVLEGSTEVRRLVLMPGEERRLTVAIEVPPGEGNYTAVLRVGEQRITLTAFVRPVGRLRVLGPPAVVECAPCSACSFEVEVANEGAATADVRLVVDAPAGLDVEVEPVYVAVLERGGKATFRVTVRPLREGTYFLTLRAESRDTSSSTRTTLVEAKAPLWARLLSLEVLVALAAVAIAVTVAVKRGLLRGKKKALLAFFRDMSRGLDNSVPTALGRRLLL